VDLTHDGVWFAMMWCLGASSCEVTPWAADRPHGPLPALLVVCMTVVTGLVDAFSYLSLGHVFVANMTGNVVSRLRACRCWGDLDCG
jgi:hypothetical protein